MSDLVSTIVNENPAPRSTLPRWRRRFDVDPGRCAVLEDAISGVRAAPAGGFGHVVGIDPCSPVDVDTLTAAVNSRDPALSSVRGGAIQQLDWIEERGFADLLPGHRAALSRLWDRFGVRVTVRAADAGSTGDAAPSRDTQTQLMVNLHTFHLLQAMSHHTTVIDAGTTARGLTGEGYRGHVFWDEVFVLPALILRLPEISEALLLYRWRRLDAARQIAREAGLAGARFPWQSGSDGREETPVELWNPRSSRWMPDHSRLQFHVGLAIAFNAWQHYRSTAETTWLAEQGGELHIEIVRLFASMADYDADELTFRLGIRPEEPAQWEHLATRLYVPFGDSGLLSQFAGYDDLTELDWEAYRRRYGNIGRMDLVLESEDDTTYRYKVSKQADVTMLFFLLGPEGVVRELHRMGYSYTFAQVEQTIDYYVARSTDGSSLSRVVNAGVLAMVGRPDAWDHWQQALRIDLDDTQWGSTAEGIHLGAMAGTVEVVVRAFAGVVTRFDRIEFHPRLPRQLEEVAFRVHFQGQVVDVQLSHTELVLVSRSHETRSIQVRVAGRDRRLEGGARLRFPL